MRALALTVALALFALPVRAENPDGGVIYDCPDTPLLAVEVDGGYYLPKPRADRIACLTTACQTHRDLLQQQNDQLRAENDGAAKTWGAVVLITGAVMFLGGYAAAKLAEKK